MSRYSAAEKPAQKWAEGRFGSLELRAVIGPQRPVQPVTPRFDANQYDKPAREYEGAVSIEETSAILPLSLQRCFCSIMIAGGPMCLGPRRPLRLIAAQSPVVRARMGDSRIDVDAHRMPYRMPCRFLRAINKMGLVFVALFGVSRRFDRL